MATSILNKNKQSDSLLNEIHFQIVEKVGPNEFMSMIEKEAPLSSLKTIFSLLKEEGHLPKRMEIIAEKSFKRIQEILEKWKQIDMEGK